MKHFYLLILSILTFQQISAQHENIEMKSFRAKEMKSFTNKMTAYNTNPNTLNYDLQYQRMDVSLDPSVYMISGSVTSHFKPNQSMSNIYFDLSNTLTVS